MNPPLLEIELTLHFDPVELTGERLKFFHEANRDLLPGHEPGERPSICTFHSERRTECLMAAADQVELLSTGGTRFPTLRPRWDRLIDSFLDTFAIPTVKRISLLYLNEIELDSLQSFRDHVSISFDMPQALLDRIEFFRSEFTYQFDLGEIHVWLQPDYQEEKECYCIQLSLEARCLEPVARHDVISTVQQLHEGIKEVFHQILSRDYIERLPQ